jgi:hypothetical protein
MGPPVASGMGAGNSSAEHPIPNCVSPDAVGDVTHVRTKGLASGV